MKITHVIHSIDRSKGGPSTYMQLLTGNLADLLDARHPMTQRPRRDGGHRMTAGNAQVDLSADLSADLSDEALAKSEALAKAEVKVDLSTEALAKVEVVTLKSPDPIALDKRITYHAEPSSKWGLFGYAPGMKSYLESGKSDLYHGNGLWQYPVHTMARTARKRKIPYILSTHGMLEPWSMTQGSLKKKLAMVLFQKHDLRQANVIHCTAHMEAKSIRAMGFTQPIAVIPNGVDEQEFPVKDGRKSHGPKKMLFLSRVHHKKGLEMLIRAFSQLDDKIKSEWSLIIAGPGEQEYIASLKELINTCGLSDHIQWKGEVYGDERKRLFLEADLFVLPTFSENFGIVVAEALASGIPVITTKGAPWEDLEKYGCGWWSAIGEEYIRSALEEALSMSDQELTERGLKGRKLIEEKYSIRKVAAQMITLYRWVLGEVEKPEFVI